MESLFQLGNKEIELRNDYKYAKMITVPYDHINENKGKLVRQTLVAIYNHWLKVENNKADRTADIVQWMHTVSLLVDDIQDASELRRGKPAAHIIYGPGRTIAAVDLATDLILYPRTEDYATSKYIQVALNCVKALFLGQTIEIYWRDNFICPTEEEYIYMISRKTGYGFKAVSLSLELFSTVNINLDNASVLFGIYFQLCDDYNALKSTACFDSKGFCDDIREGKFTFPIIHAVNKYPNDKRILNILKMHTSDINLKKKVLDLLEEFGSLEYTRNKINSLKNSIIQEISAFEHNPYFNKIFETIDIKSDE